MSQSHRLSLILLAAVLTFACLPTLGPAPAPLPTLDPNAPLTAIVQTAAAAATQTAIHSSPTPTATLPTNTPTVTPTATPTFLFLLPTSDKPPTQIPLGSSQAVFDCQVLSVEPKAQIGVSTRFIGKWVIANIGKGTWDVNSLDYRYAEGDKFHLQSIYDFPATVTPGLIVELTVDMQAPSTAGEYTTVWRIKAGNKEFCPMEMKIVVK